MFCHRNLTDRFALKRIMFRNNIGGQIFDRPFDVLLPELSDNFRYNGGNKYSH